MRNLERIESFINNVQEFEKKIKAAYEQDSMRLMAKNKNWEGLESRLLEFKKGIVLGFLSQEGLCREIMQEMYEVTGIRFDLTQIREAKVAIESASAADKGKVVKEWAKRIGEPIDAFLAREEGKLASLPMFKKEEK